MARSEFDYVRLPTEPNRKIGVLPSSIDEQSIRYPRGNYISFLRSLFKVLHHDMRVGFDCHFELTGITQPNPNVLI